MKNLNTKFSILFSIIIILVVAIIFLIISSSDKQRKLEYTQDLIDQLYVSQLSQIASCFGRDLEYENFNNYQQCTSEIAGASTISMLTTYEEKNDLTDVALYGLYKNMLNIEKRDLIIENTDELRGIFIKLFQDPFNKKVVEDLVNLNSKIMK